MTSEWTTLPEWIEIRIPSKDKLGRPISRKKRDQWLKRWQQFLLNPAGMGGKGYETLSKHGTWPKAGRGIFDPLTSELRCIEERVDGLKMYCSGRQLDFFGRKGKELLVEMGRDLNQDAVAYSDPQGLHIRHLTPTLKKKR